MLVTSVFVTLLSVSLMWGGEDPFLPDKMKSMVQEECRAQVNDVSYKAIEDAFDQMFEKMVDLNTTALEELFKRDEIKDICNRSTPFLQSIANFIDAARPCLSSTEKSRSYNFIALNKGIWGLVCSDIEFRSSAKCYANKEDEMAICFRGFQGFDNRSSKDRTEACKEFKSDMECALEVFKECGYPNVVEVARQYIEYLLNENICWEFSLAQTQWLHQTELISTDRPIV
ncbi:uncharacterized protein LOC119067487 [Bradysia coprophila]|uniref:uncharacterized protein LOC119067487 n=1 Tax=Bradysia coprophila TaxID=38358 RepID=UPI00187D70D5|nr:uncharacterized protein LOC119067487 [Bradysia coprophila]